MTVRDADGSPLAPESGAPAYAVPAAVAWAAVVAVLGGLACGWIMGKFDHLGTLSLWLLGVVGGSVSVRITRGPSRAAAWALAVACVGAALLALIAWLRWTTVQGEEGWLKSASLLPALFREAQILVLAAAIMAACGAHSAWWIARGR